MKYWWVNHNKTGDEEVGGHFLWSPKTNSHGGRNQTYENMKLASPGEPVLSYRGSAVRSVGIVAGRAFEAPKPGEFGSVAQEWAPQGWRLPVAFAELPKALRPREHLDLLRPLLPSKYSPLVQETGAGVQAYLFEISEELYLAVMDLLEEE